jgi:N-acetylglucosaminyl-diphospho-decaprenol L-rhamnosyltransferase
MTPAVDIVIPTLDGGEMLTACLEKVAGRADVGVILVDNGSTDGSIERALDRFPAIRVVRNETNRGYAPACNQGAAQATAPLVLFLNNDALLELSQLDALLDAARSDDRTAIWQPVTYGTDGTLEATGDHFTWWGIFRHLQAPPASSGDVEVFSTVGAALLVRRSAFEELGGFEDSYFAYYEESDLCWRARVAGWNVKVVIDARVEHIGSSTTGQIFEPHAVRYLSFRNRIRTNLATPAASTLWRIVPLHIVACIGFVLFYVVTGRVKSAGAVLSAMWWPVGNRDVLADQRARTQAIRKLPDAQVIRRDLVSSFGPREIWRHLKRSYWFERAAARVSESTRKN